MPKAFLGRGWKFPVAATLDRGKIATSEYEQDIREAIWIILSTSKGERVMRPDFGCGAHDLVFASMNKATLGLIETSVREALTTWERRIDLLKIEISTEDAANGKLLIGIDYRVRETNNDFNLVYPFYLTEGT
jgi:phage baseplate assembly protein W